MARAGVTYRYAETGDSIAVDVSCTNEHPDALDQMTARCHELYLLVMAPDTTGTDDANPDVSEPKE